MGDERLGPTRNPKFLRIIEVLMKYSAGHDKCAEIFLRLAEDLGGGFKYHLRPNGFDANIFQVWAWDQVEQGKIKVEKLSKRENREGKVSHMIGMVARYVPDLMRRSSIVSGILQSPFRQEVEKIEQSPENIAWLSSHYLPGVDPKLFGLFPLSRPLQGTYGYCSADLFLHESVRGLADQPNVRVFSHGRRNTKAYKELGVSNEKIIEAGFPVSRRIYEAMQKRVAIHAENGNDPEKMDVRRKFLVPIGGGGQEVDAAFQAINDLYNLHEDADVTVLLGSPLGDGDTRKEDLRKKLEEIKKNRKLNLIGGESNYKFEQEIQDYANALEDHAYTDIITRPNESFVLGAALGFNVHLNAQFQNHEERAYEEARKGVLANVNVWDLNAQEKYDPMKAVFDLEAFENPNHKNHWIRAAGPDQLLQDEVFCKAFCREP